MLTSIQQLSTHSQTDPECTSLFDESSVFKSLYQLQIVYSLLTKDPQEEVCACGACYPSGGLSLKNHGDACREGDRSPGRHATGVLHTPPSSFFFGRWVFTAFEAWCFCHVAVHGDSKSYRDDLNSYQDGGEICGGMTVT